MYFPIPTKRLKKINKIKIIKNKEPLMCGKCSIVSFENKITCRCYRHKKMYLGINGKDMSSNMRTVFYPAVIGWTLLGVWISTLHIRVQLLKLKKEGLL